MSPSADKFWILGCAAAQGLLLVAMHYSIRAMGEPARWFAALWPAYAWIILLPLSLQMLAAWRGQAVLWRLLAGLALVALMMAGYLGWNAYIPGLGQGQHYGYFGGAGAVLAFSLGVGWWVLLPFAQYRLQAGRFGADYPFLFAACWRNLLQLASATGFLGLLWALLALWAALFKVLHVEWFGELFSRPYFAYPATSLGFGLGLALYQTREAALYSLYGYSLAVMGWLLPVAAALAVGFLGALPFTGLEPLWNTGHATALMLVLQAFMLLLFNAVWQDGAGAALPPPWLRRPLAWAMALLPVYAGLCAYALGLRVAQHGWSGDRVWAALLVLLVGCFGLGYARCALAKGAWMAGVDRVNVAGALLLALLLVATATPLLAPERIGVASQIDRLLSGQTRPGEFDYHYLRFQAGRWGNDALERLAKLDGHPQGVAIREQAAAAQKLTEPYGRGQKIWTAAEIAARLSVYPPGAVAEPSFLSYLAEAINHKEYTELPDNANPVSLLSLDLNGDGSAEYVLFGQSYGAEVFARSGGRWTKAGALMLREGIWNIDQINQDIVASQWRALPPPWQDLQIGNRRFVVGR